jgi:hypothetical protein
MKFVLCLFTLTAKLLLSHMLASLSWECWCLTWSAVLEIQIQFTVYSVQTWNSAEQKLFICDSFVQCSSWIKCSRNFRRKYFDRRVREHTQNYPCNRPVGLWDVEDPPFSRRPTDSGEVVSFMSKERFSGTHFC